MGPWPSAQQLGLAHFQPSPPQAQRSVLFSSLSAYSRFSISIVKNHSSTCFPSKKPDFRAISASFISKEVSYEAGKTNENLQLFLQDWVNEHSRTCFNILRRVLNYDVSQSFVFPIREVSQRTSNSLRICLTPWYSLACSCWMYDGLE